ncbi:MAG: hypothetical protein KYX68_11825 [Flavobacterium sp.]|nr:hypothetical protein [Flavobacterium sp.]
MYRFRQKEFYSNIISQLKSFGYHQTDESIFDERVTATYQNKGFVLKIAYNRESDETDNDDYYYSSSYKKTYTVYEVSIYKKGGVYDPDNGFKKEYYDGGALHSEFFLKNGKMEGELKVYNEDGTQAAIVFFKNGIKAGKQINFDYFEENKETYLKTVTSYKDGKIDGNVIRYVVSPNETYIFEYFNFKDNVLQGRALVSKENKIIEKFYVNGELNGSYKEFLELKSSLLGGLARIDTLQSPPHLLLEQNYVNDKLNGEAKEFDVSGSLIAEGIYKDSLKTGIWKFYYQNFKDDDGNKIEYAGKLHTVSSYAKGKLNGKTEKYSYTIPKKIPCKDKNSEEECFRNDIIYVNETSYYVNDELEGLYELKNIDGEIIAKGIYLKGKENGEWIQSTDSDFVIYDSEENTREKGVYVNGLKQGKWERFDENNILLESCFYLDNQVHGKHTSFSKGGIPFINKYFRQGEFYKFEIYNSLGEISLEVEILNHYKNKLKIKETTFSIDRQESITYEIEMNTDFKLNNILFPLQYGKLEDKDKVKDGFYDLYDKDGKPLSQGEFDNNRRVSKWEDFYYDQQVKVTTNYDYYGVFKSDTYYDLKKNEPYSGEFIFANSENKTTEERKIKDGLRHGKTRIKDAKGDTIEKINYKEGVVKE